jgi:hypothetical protein
MPCTDGGYSNDQYDEMRARLNKATALLCEVLTQLEGQSSVFVGKDGRILYNKLDPENLGLESWWVKHQEDDRRRIEKENQAIEKEKIKQKALNKLSPEEKRLLGLK